ncbi:MAG TPA: ABC transporter permease [Armatimonadota bacterium]|nr:ABC transporter permease [Armatimonadota bacterium]
MILRTWMMIWKEFKQISRDPRMLAVAVLLPVFMLLLYGYAINLDVRHVRMAVYDQDHSQQSREMINAFSCSGYFDIVGYLDNDHDIAPELDDSKAKMVLVIPVTFSHDLADGRRAQVQVLVDGSDSTTASTAIGYATMIIQQQSLKIALSAGQVGATQPIDHRSRFWYNPELKSTNFIIPGLIAVILMMLSALLTSVTVVRERERGTIEQLIVSPVKPIEIMLGKLIPYVLIAFCDVILVLIVSTLIFHIPLIGSPLLVLALSAIFVIAALGIGLLISTVAPNQQVAMLVAIMATQLPTVLLSGFMFPISSMPRAIQVLTNIIPAAHFIRILRAIFLKGSGFMMLWKPSLLLLLIGLLMLVLSSVRFRKKL